MLMYTEVKALTAADLLDERVFATL